MIARPRRPGELRWPDRTVLGAIVLLLAIATLALIGYATGVEGLKRVFPDLPPMRITTALCLLALAAGIWLKRLPGQRPRSLGSLLGGLIAVVGLLVVIGRLEPFGPLAGTLFAAGGESTGLPSPGSGIGLILTGLCLLVLDADPGRHRPAGVLIALTGLLAFGALVGYAYDVEYLRGGGAAAGVPLSSAIAFALAAAALGCLRPQRGLVAALHGEDEIDATGRRLTAIAILAPVVIGLIELAGADAGIYDARVGASLFTVLTVGVLTVLSLTYLSQVRRAESARIEASRNLDRSERSFRAVADSAIEVVVTADNHGRIAYNQPRRGALLRLVGRSARRASADDPDAGALPRRAH
ncbi:MAG: hypothetical protein H0W09_01450 [Solirubrobacterales bacterium]|nr:hypothetical protein [Solirubrobacterales bacterium]